LNCFYGFILGKKEKKSGTKKNGEESRKKHFSNGYKNKLVPEEVSLTVTKSHRVSRRPSEWWLVKSEESKYFY
jgi:centromere protein C